MMGDDEAMAVALRVLGAYLDLPHHPLKPDDAIVRAVHGGAAAERARVVEWLRGGPIAWRDGIGWRHWLLRLRWAWLALWHPLTVAKANADMLADAIERGEHWPKPAAEDPAP